MGMNIYFYKTKKINLSSEDAYKADREEGLKEYKSIFEKYDKNNKSLVWLNNKLKKFLFKHQIDNFSLKEKRNYVSRFDLKEEFSLHKPYLLLDMFEIYLNLSLKFDEFRYLNKEDLDSILEKMRECVSKESYEIKKLYTDEDIEEIKFYYKYFNRLSKKLKDDEKVYMTLV